MSQFGGSVEVDWYGDRVSAVIRGNSQRALRTSALILQRNLKRRLSRAGSGIQYPRQPARSSAPGEPPAAQTGNLRRSVQVDLSGLRERRPLSVRVGTSVDYGFFLEYGTIHIRPRPWMRPTVRASRRAIADQFRWSRLIRGYRPPPPRTTP